MTTRRNLLNAHAVIFSLTTLLVVVTASECHAVTSLPTLLYSIALWGWWGIIASTLWKLSQRFPSILTFSPKILTVHLFVGITLAFLHHFVMAHLGNITAELSDASAVWRRSFDLNHIGIGLLLYGFILGFAGIVQLQMRAQRQSLNALELQKQLSAAHLHALQMQLEPHFLFNTLNAITTLVELGRQHEAARMLSHLNAILKSALKRATPEKVPLSQELELVENYLAIEQVRFADRLRIEMKVEPAALDCLVPCFLLQPIVENAIRHGIAHCETEGLVEASARLDGPTLHLTVRDSGSLPPAHLANGNGHGIGLRNTRERLSHFYGNAYAMKAESLSTGGFEVAIDIPYERN
jgi:sensor histidine kinase YesM